MTITTLIENTKQADAMDLHAEHGLSLLIECAAGKILFDTGASGKFADNAAKLHIDLQNVDLAVISHGHSDHGGGIPRFLAENSRAQIYLLPTATERHLFKMFGIIPLNISLNNAAIQANANRFAFVQSTREIAKNVWILSEISSRHPLPVGNKSLFTVRNGKTMSDDFTHELVLAIREQDGIVVFTGCSHRGILNMVEAVQTHFPNVPIKAVFGGFHCMNPTTKRMAETEATVQSIGTWFSENPQVQKVFTGHCTGNIAYQVLQRSMGAKLGYCATGMTINI